MQTHSNGRRTPALTKALQFLDTRNLKKGPVPIRRLAHEADVSYVTMWKAVQLRSVHPAVSKPALQAHEKSSRPTTAWQRLKSRIEQDLLQARLPNATALPSAKELCARYDVDYRTLRKALEALCSQDFLHSAGRRYRAAAGRTTSSSFRIAVLAFAWYEGPLILFAEYDQEYLTCLDAESSRRRIRAEVLRYMERDGRAIVNDSHGISEQNIQTRKDIDGFVVLVWSTNCLSDDLFAQLHAAGKPVVIIDEIGGWEMPAYLVRGGKTLRLDARPHESAARNAARELVALGHRRFAFFSAFHNDLWSRQCLTGFTGTIDRAGGSCSVRAFLVNGSQATNEYTRAGWSRCPDKPFRKALSAWARSAPRPFVKQFEPYFAVSLDQQAWYAEVRYRLEPLFRQALTDKSITCWVAPDADDGWMAHDYLHERKSRVSLLAFGNSPEITRSRITSWDYNCAGAVTATLDHLLYPKRRLAGQNGIVLRIEGGLAMRESLRRV